MSTDGGACCLPADPLAFGGKGPERREGLSEVWGLGDWGDTSTAFDIKQQWHQAKIPAPPDMSTRTAPPAGMPPAAAPAAAPPVKRKSVLETLGFKSASSREELEDGTLKRESKRKSSVGSILSFSRKKSSTSTVSSSENISTAPHPAPEAVTAPTTSSAPTTAPITNAALEAAAPMVEPGAQRLPPLEESSKSLPAPSQPPTLTSDPSPDTVQSAEVATSPSAHAKLETPTTATSQKNATTPSAGMTSPPYIDRIVISEPWWFGPVHCVKVAVMRAVCLPVD